MPCHEADLSIPLEAEPAMTAFRLSRFAGVAAVVGCVAVAHPAVAQVSAQVAAHNRSKNQNQIDAIAGPSTATATNAQILQQLQGGRLIAGGLLNTPSNVFGASTSASSFGAPVGGPIGGGPAAKPFQDANLGPTVSPYLQLFNSDGTNPNAAIDNYQTLVRPQLQQQRFNRQVQQQAQALNARVQQISAQSAYQPQGSEQIMGTGHTTFFGYYGRYYPSLRGRR